ncbi:hypothetical protein ABOM_011804 [Aspergillus bombycis]|uniref:proline dehydrogenase n=1 Tax=Aspergillus bombycis TaxID=109264 RepID=A0A1F7ZK24_9EURO|nr:hypothetical protein ABOM_011804 [Aspergillus bombycis]OGM39385.1 hypothetical protein ABOM_011804 [Aspergillus bombycis]
MLPQSTFPVRLRVASGRRKSLLAYPKYTNYHHEPVTKPEIKPYRAVSPMARLPTRILLRSLVLTSLMSSKILIRPALTILNILAISKSPFLNADRNSILNKALRLTVYDHFCAGTNHTEVSRTIADTKRIGYQGVILGYSKEVILYPNGQSLTDSISATYSDRCYEMVEEWKEGTLETLRMLEPGDFLALKLTGAGPISVDAMAACQPMPEVVAKAVNTICVATAQQRSRLWLDAEQQMLQPGLDKWAIEMMRTHNRSETPVVYNTIQGYLKGSKANVDNHIKLAAQEGWSLGIKLVRGAYIEHENRALIHDTKEETDSSYDMIADMLLGQRLPAEVEHLQFPPAALFLATHNAASTAKAITTHQERILAGQPTVTLECGQIQGMADELSCELLHSYLRELEEQITRSATSGRYTTSIGVEHQGLPPLTRSEAVDLSPTPNVTTYLAPDGRQTAGWQMASDDSPIRNPGRRVGTGERQVCHDSEFSKNPLVDKKEWAFAATPDGRYWYMGPSSSWSFCRRVLALLGKRVPESNSPPDPWHLDGMAFKLQWKQVPPEETPDVTNIPPLDYALFLYNTAKYYLASLSFLIDETLYLQELHEFYLDPAAKAASRRSWFAQYLLVLAFGKAFITQRNPSGSPTGHQYASRAMALLPDLSGIHEDPLTSIQALSLAALYFQSIDMRKAAFQHIGQALRCCIIEGIHRHVPEELGGPELSQRCQAVFWVVYMLDREFSALMGGPNSIRDEDITVRLPAEVAYSVENANLTLHVRLARLMAQILTTVYGVDSASNGALIRDIQSILHALADLSQDITEFLDSSFHGTISRGSKMAVRLMLAQHHCVVLTTRPLVMCALNMHIDSAERQPSQGICLSPPVASLLQCCADSAQTILQTLRSLADDDLMDAFLPFQVEHASSSAFVLYLIRSIAPSLIANESWCDNLDCVIEKLISKGNLAAPLRKLELRHLDLMLTPLTPRSATHTVLPVTSDEIQDNNDDTYALDQVDIGDEVEWDLLALNHSVSLPPRELLDLADQLDVDSIMQSMDA